MNQQYNYYMKEFMVLWVKAIWLFVFAAAIESGSGNGAPQVSYLVPLAVFGIQFFDRVVPFDLFGNHGLVIAFWIIKAVISCLIGIIAFPIVNVYYILKIVFALFDKYEDEMEV